MCHHPMKTRKRKCKICGTRYTPKESFQTWCFENGTDCAIETLRLKRKKKQRKEDAKTRERLKPRNKWLSEAQFQFNKFIRLRDERLPCISCGTVDAGQYHASHYYSRGARPDLRFNEDNVHKSCAQCNNFLSGNISEFRKALVRKIGQERVDALEIVGRSDWDIPEIKAIKEKYKAKLK